MIAFVEGKVCEKFPDFLIISHQGIGLRLNYDPLYASRMPAVGEEARIYTYLSIRENDMSLYAFPQYEEKQLFELLITVSGIGAKLGGSIVASISPAQFALAILNGDVKRLTKIKGVGKKTAERMILELKDKIKKQADSLISTEDESALLSQSDFADGDQAAAISALQVLGYTRQEAKQAVAAAYAAREGDLDLDELIRRALKSMAKM